MARRKRVRVAVGFGAGGRGALLSSLVPTASEKADAERAKRAVDNAKIAAFNRDEISIEELTAYFSERKGQATTDIERTEIQAFIDNATASDKKKKSVKAYNAAAAALGDYKNGQGSYDDAITALKAAQSTVTDPEQRANITRLITSAGQIKTERVVNAAVEDYNAGRLTYDALRTTLSETHASETNEQIKTAVMKSLDQARDAENKKVMARATSDYNAGRGGIAEFSATLSALRDAPDQKNPDTIAQINAAMAAAQVNEQGIEDQKAYNRWVTKQADDATTMQYFNGRLAAEKNPKSLDHLGKYAGNIQQSIQANAEKAEATARSVGSRASGTADAQLKAANAQALEAINEYDKTVFVPTRDKAWATNDPYLIVAAYADRKRELIEIGPSAGSMQGAFSQQANDMDRAGKVLASAAEIQRLVSVTTPLVAAAKAADKDKTSTPLERAEAWEAVARENIRAERSGWLIDPTQIRVTVRGRAQSADGIQAAINDLRDQSLELGGDAKLRVDGLYRSLLDSTVKSRNAMLEEAGIDPNNADSQEAKSMFGRWIQENPSERVMQILSATNMGAGFETNINGQQTNKVELDKLLKAAEEITDTIADAGKNIGSIDATTGLRGYGGAKMADMKWKLEYITNPDAVRYGTDTFYTQEGRDDFTKGSKHQPMALPNPDGTYTKITDPTISEGEWWETRATRDAMNAQGDTIDAGDTNTGKPGMFPEMEKFGRSAGSFFKGVGEAYGDALTGAKDFMTRPGAVVEATAGSDLGQFIGDAWEGFSFRDGRWVSQSEAAGLDAAASQTMSPLEGTPGYVDYEMDAALGAWGGFDTPSVDNSDPYGGGFSAPEPYLQEPVGLSPIEGTPGYVPDPYEPELPAFAGIDLPTTWDTSWDGGGNSANIDS